MCEWDGETYRWSGTYGLLILFTSACCIITISFIADYYYDAESRWDGVNTLKSLCSATFNLQGVNTTLR